MPKPKPAVFTKRNRQKLQSLLQDAILADDRPLIRKRLAQGADPASFTCDERGLTALMDAAVIGNPHVIEMFLPLCDIDAISADGESALCLFMDRLSCINNSNPPQSWLKSLRQLCPKSPATRHACSPLSRAALCWDPSAPDINIVISELAPFSDFSMTGIYEATPCSIALRRPCVSRGAIALAIFRADPLNAIGESMRPELYELIHSAADSNQVEFLKAVVPMAPMDFRNALGRTPFLAAAAATSFEAMELLVAMGCDPGAIDNEGCDALMLAIENGGRNMDFKRLIALIPASNLFYRDNLHESALDKARDRAMDGLAEIIEARLSQSPASPPSPMEDCAPPPTPSGKLQQLLVQAIEDNNMALIDKRLRQGANLSLPAQDSSDSPFLIALRQCPHETIRHLIPLADLSAPNAHGEMPLAAYLRSSSIHDSESLSIMEALLSPEAVFACESSGDSPLGLLRATPAFFPLALRSLSALSDWEKIDFYPFSVNHSPNHSPLWQAHPNQAWLATQANADGETLAHAAAGNNNAKLLLAISAHADFAAKDAQGRTPLMFACSYGYVNADRAAAIATLAPWSDCRAVDHNGCDALMLSMENSCEDDFHEIIQHLAPRADLFARDFLGESALDKALDRGLVKAAESIQNFLAIQQERSDLAASIPNPTIASTTAGKNRI